MNPESNNKPFIRNVGRFKLSNGKNGLNLKIHNKFFVIPKTELDSVLNGEQETGSIREYKKGKEE